MNRPGGRLFAGLIILFIAGCRSPRVAAPPEPGPPPAPREFRAAWVATVANIDWPSHPGLPVAQQRAEIIAMLDKARALKLNAIVLQVRPAADALYASALEPWSEYLTGQQGRAPEPFYDPLKVWIEEAHRRGLALHAWFNPYRARHHQAKSAFAPTHIAKTNPASVKHYGELWWMDPGDAFAALRTLAVVADVVRRYDVDGVQIDDYFYPYPITAPTAGGPAPKPGEPVPTVDFPDEPSWRLYLASGGKLSRADWRRQNVSHLVDGMYRTIHQVKPGVLFGISPFGLGRPDRRPPGIAGFSQYDKLYADVELWIEKGWLDYLAPQLYWPKTEKAQSFEVLLDYWAKQIGGRRHLWPGLFTSAINDTPKSWSAQEITGQIGMARANPAASGQIHFSMVALMEDRRGVGTMLQTETYKQPALVPRTPWLGTVAPLAPSLVRQRDGRVRIVPTPGGSAAVYAVWRGQSDVWRFSVEPAGDTTIEAGASERIVVSAVDRLGNESGRVTLVPAARAGRP